MGFSCKFPLIQSIYINIPLTSHGNQTWQSKIPMIFPLQHPMNIPLTSVTPPGAKRASTEVSWHAPSRGTLRSQSAPGFLIWRSWGSLGREILLDMIIWYNMTCWVYSIFNLHQSTSIYINLHQSTSIYINLHQSTSIYYVAWLNMIKLLKLIWFEESNSWRSWSLATGWIFALSRQTSSAPPSRAGSVRSARSATRTFSGHGKQTIPIPSGNLT